MRGGSVFAARAASTTRAARCAAAAVLLTPGLGSAAPAPPRPCAHVVVSPAFAVDGTVFCAGSITSNGLTAIGPGMVVSTDRGRTWRAVSATGLPNEPSAKVLGLVVSPRYASDRTVIVNLSLKGLYLSTDNGETFTPLLPVSVPTVTSFVSGIGLSGEVLGARMMLLMPSGVGGRPMLIDTLTRTVQPVPGAPAPAHGALVSPAWTTDHTALLFTHEVAGSATRVAAYGCSVTFECVTPLGRLPAGYTFDQAWPAADFATSRTLFVKVRPDAARSPRIYVSRDVGKSFSPMPTAQKLIDAHVKTTLDSEPVVSLATGRPGTDRVWMRIYGAQSASLAAAELYRSDDNGRTWVRVAFGRIAERTPRGTMHDLRVPPGEPHTALLAATTNDVLFMNGITKGGWTASCSTDRGRTWSTFCR